MFPPPVALSLALCDYVIVEAGTEKISLIGTFSKMAVDGFTTPARPFCVFAAFTDGAGHAMIDSSVTNLDSIQTRVFFPNKLHEVNLIYRINDCLFPTPAWYEFALLVDGELLAQRRMEIIS